MATIEEIREYVRLSAQEVREHTFEHPELMDHEDKLALIADTLFKIFDYNGEPHRDWIKYELRNVFIPKSTKNSEDQ
jgi:hypothetical protein